MMYFYSFLTLIATICTVSQANAINQGVLTLSESEAKTFDSALSPAISTLIEAEKLPGDVFLVELESYRPSRQSLLCQRNNRESQVYRVAMRSGDSGQLYEMNIKLCIHESLDPIVLDITDPTPIVEPNVRNIVTILSGGEQDDDCDTSKTVQQKLCLPSGYEVFGWNNVDIRSHQRNNEIKRIEPHPTNLSCINVTFKLRGRGYDKIAGVKVNCKGSAYLKFDISVYGTAHFQR